VIKQEFTLLLGAEPIRLETPRRRQLVEEIRKLTEVHHPRLASVHDLDFHENRPVLVTELVRGRPLAEEFGVVRPPAADAAMWLAEVAHGLSALHGVGAIHGLVSPATIVVDEQGLPRLLHAGLSLLAPESTRADHSPRKDVVALAAVLCFLLSGCETESAKLNSANAPDRLKALCRQGFVDEVSRDAKHFASELEERAGARSLLGRAVASLQGWLKPRREV
jgi:serine/threonine protein kinase